MVFAGVIRALDALTLEVYRDIIEKEVSCASEIFWKLQEINYSVRPRN
jgi:hypothetical protein